MEEDIITAPSEPTAPRPGGSGRTVLLAALLSFLLGAALTGWLAWSGRVPLLTQRSAIPATMPRAAPSPTAPPATPEGLAVTQSSLEQRLGALEQRLDRIDLQAAAAAGNATRAEGMLIAFAARRALERGSPLGPLEDQLKLRFADAQPNAVQAIVDASAQPVTLDQLIAGLAQLGPEIAQAHKAPLGWVRIRDEISELFVVRHDSTSSVTPASRLDHARAALYSGRVEDAVGEVERLPNARAAQDWLTSARRYVAAQRALDLIETTALLDSRRLGDDQGHKVDQPSPLETPPAP